MQTSVSEYICFPLLCWNYHVALLLMPGISYSSVEIYYMIIIALHVQIQRVNEAFCQVQRFSCDHLSRRIMFLHPAIEGSLLESRERRTLLPELPVSQTHFVHEVFAPLSLNPV